MYTLLSAPEYRLTLPEVQITQGFSATYISSRKFHCDQCRIYPGEELLEQIAGYDVSQCVTEIGNDQDEEYDILIDGDGIWQEDGTQILIRDEMHRLYDAMVKATFVDVTIAEAVRYVLTVCHVAEYVISSDLTGGFKTFTIGECSGCDALDKIATAWGVDAEYGYKDGVFYYGKLPEQEDVYEISDDNLLDLEAQGECWLLEVIGLPPIRQSQMVLIDSEELTCLAKVEQCEIRSDGDDTEMFLTVKEIEDA